MASYEKKVSDWGMLRNIHVIIGPTEAHKYLAKYLLYVIETTTLRSKGKVQYMFVDMSSLRPHNGS